MFSKLSKEVEKRAYYNISEELIAGKVDNGIWTKAFSESDGNSDKARAKYIKYRFKEVEEKILNDIDIERNREIEKRKREERETESKKEKVRTASERLKRFKSELPMTTERALEAEAKLRAKKDLLESLFNHECLLVDAVACSSGLARKVERIRLNWTRNKIIKTKDEVGSLSLKAHESQKTRDYQLKKIRELEHFFGL